MSEPDEKIQIYSKPRVFSTLSEGWRSIAHVTLFVYMRLSLIFVVLILLSIVTIIMTMFLPDLGKTAQEMVSVLMGTSGAIISAMMMVPLSIICIRSAVNLPLDMKVVKDQCSKSMMPLLSMIVIYFIACGLISAVIDIIQLPPLLTLIVGLILTLLSITVNAFALPLIVLRKINAKDAFNIALEKVLKNIIYIILCLVLVCIVSMLPSIFACLLYLLAIKLNSLLVAIIAGIMLFTPALWLVPWSFAVGGIMFRDVYRLKVADNTGADKNPKSMRVTWVLFGVSSFLIALITWFIYDYVILSLIAFLISLGNGGDKQRVQVSPLERKIHAISSVAFNKRSDKNGFSEVKTEDFARSIDMSSPWGKPITISNATVDTYTVTFAEVPFDDCIEMNAVMKNLSILYDYNPDQCERDHNGDFSYTFNDKKIYR